MGQDGTGWDGNGMRWDGGVGQDRIDVLEEPAQASAPKLSTATSYIDVASREAGKGLIVSRSALPQVLLLRKVHLRHTDAAAWQ